MLGSGFRLAGLVDECGVFLVAFGGEADVVELNFVGAGLGDEFGEGDVVILDYGVGGIGPDQLPVFAPGLAGFVRMHGEFGMGDDQALVAEDGDAGDGVHVFGVQKVHELGQVVNVDLMLAEQRMFEGDGNAAVGIFDVEDDGVAADLAPVADDAEPVIAGGHDAGEIDGADFEIFGDGDGVLDDGCGEDSGDGDLFAGLENVAGAIAVGGADGVGQFARSEIACVL